MAPVLETTDRCDAESVYQSTTALPPWTVSAGATPLLAPNQWGPAAMKLSPSPARGRTPILAPSCTSNHARPPPASRARARGIAFVAFHVVPPSKVANSCWPTGFVGTNA